MIQAKVVADSVNPFGDRITSMLITFPRIILAEAKTHRIISGLHEEVDISMNSFKEGSKNSASSRAIPAKRMIEMIKTNPFIPIAWQKEHKGMQGTEYITDPNDVKSLILGHLRGRDQAIDLSEYQTRLGATKQISNRYLEPFMWTTVLVTSTEWSNFFELRCPDYVTPHGTFKSIKDLASYTSNNIGCYYEVDEKKYMDGMQCTFIDALRGLNKGQAEIHMMALAEAMWDARNESKPRELKAGEWHIPFESKIDIKQIEEFPVITGLLSSKHEGTSGIKVKVSTAMAARTSYTTVGEEKEVKYGTLIGIHDKMAIAKPFHASPFEHCNKAMSENDLDNYLKIEDSKTSVGWCRNFKGFIQYRALLEGGTL